MASLTERLNAAGTAKPRPSGSLMDRLGGNKQQENTGNSAEAFGMGLADPIHGGAQLLAHMAPKSLVEAVNAVPRYLQSIQLPEALRNRTNQGQVLPGATPEQLDKQIADREQAYQAKRGPGAGFDWGRLGGNVVSGLPLSMMVPGAGVASAAGGGAVMGAMQPVTEGDFTTQKAMQTGLGAAGGAVVAPIANAAVNAASRLMNSAPNAASRANAILAKALQRDNMTVSQAANRLAGLGDDAVLADLGGNVRGVARAAANLPGRTSRVADDFLSTRAASAPERVRQISASAAGHRGEAFGSTFRGLREARRIQADPLYRRAYENPVPYTTELENILRTPAAERAFARARTIAANERVYFPENYQIFIRAVQGEPVTAQHVPSARLWHFIKRGLDDQLETFRDKTTRRLALDERGRSIERVRRELLAELDRLNPDYQVARNSYSGPSAMMTAMERGRGFVKRDVEVTADEIARLGDADREAFLMGVSRALSDIVDKPGGVTRMNRLLQGREFNNKLRAALPDEESYRSFLEGLGRERVFQETSNYIIAGSRTTPLAKEIEALEKGSGAFAAAQEAISAARGSVSGSLGLGARIAGPAVNRMRSAMGERTRDALGEALFTPGVANNSRILDRLIQDEIVRQLNARIAQGLVPLGSAGATATLKD